MGRRWMAALIALAVAAVGGAAVGATAVRAQDGSGKACTGRDEVRRAPAERHDAVAHGG